MQMSLRNVFLLGFYLLIGSAYAATDWSGAERPCESLELLLTERGIGTSTSSLLEIAGRKGDPGDRWIAIEILGLRGEREALGVLRKILAEEPDRLLRETAALALARLEDEAGLPALREFLHTASESHRQVFLAARLAELGDPVGFRYVTAASRADSADHRFSSVAALVAFLPFAKDPDELLAQDPEELLLGLARDEEARVRWEVLVQIPMATSKGVEATVFCSVLKELAADERDPRIMEQAALLLSTWFQECADTAGKVDRP